MRESEREREKSKSAREILNCPLPFLLEHRETTIHPKPSLPKSPEVVSLEC